MQSDKNVAARSGYYSAEDLNIRLSRLQTLERNGRLKPIQIGVRLYWPKADVERLRPELEGASAVVPPRYKTSEEIARALGVHIATVTNWCRFGRFPAVKARSGNAVCWHADLDEATAYALTTRLSSSIPTKPEAPSAAKSNDTQELGTTLLRIETKLDRLLEALGPLK